MRAKISTTTAQSLKVKKAWIVAGGIALAGVVIFAVVLGFNVFGIYRPTKAAGSPTSKYPFDMTDEALRKVNFMALAPQINSVFAEVRPVITANGKDLYFCRRNHPENILKQKDKQDIWVSTLLADDQ